MLLYIIRHGEPDYTTDTLTERRILQAEAVGKRIADSKIDMIFSSPMGRARQTAEPACRNLGLDCNIEEWTHEIGFTAPKCLCYSDTSHLYSAKLDMKYDNYIEI